MTGSVALPTSGFLPIFLPAQKEVLVNISLRPTRIGGWALINPNATVAYVLFFDSFSSPSLGVDIPTFVMPLPGTAAANLFNEKGIFMRNGLWIACTTTALGSSPPGIGLDVSIFYQ